MHTISDIEKTVASLSPDELAEFRAWFEAFDACPLSAAQAEEINKRLDALEAGELPPAESWDKVKAWLQTL